MLPQERLDALKRKHARVSALIESEQNQPSVSALYLRQLKQQKLKLKDEIELNGEDNDKTGRLMA